MRQLDSITGWANARNSGGQRGLVCCGPWSCGVGCDWATSCSRTTLRPLPRTPRCLSWGTGGGGEAGWARVQGCPRPPSCRVRSAAGGATLAAALSASSRAARCWLPPRCCPDTCLSPPLTWDPKRVCGLRWNSLSIRVWGALSLIQPWINVVFILAV